MPKKPINMVSRTVKEINVEDLQLVALDNECFELLLFCSREHRRRGEVAYHKRMYRCAITDFMLDKLEKEIRDKYLTSAEPGPEPSEDESDD